MVLGAYEGYKHGFLFGILGLVGFVVAVVLGFYFMDPMTDWLAENVKDFNFTYPVVAFLIIFFLSLIIIRVAAWILKKLMDLTILGTFDSFAGILLGVVKSAFFLSLFLWLTQEFDLDLPKEWKKSSEIIPYIEPLAPTVIQILEPVFPSMETTQEKIEELVEKLKDAAVD